MKCTESVKLYILLLLKLYKEGQSLFEKIDEKQLEINRYRPLNHIQLNELKDYYKIGLVYSSNAIEGNTLDISETKVVLEDGITIGGKPMKDHLEVIGSGAAFDEMIHMINDKKELTEQSIKRLHKVLYAPIDIKNAGVYRKKQVYISGSEYSVATASEIALKMKEFILKMTEIKDTIHPVEYAARFHQELVYIHPFIDGNGRLCRTLMNLIFLQYGYPIVCISPIVKADYIRALEQGHKNPNLFIKFIAEQVIEGQKDYLRLVK